MSPAPARRRRGFTLIELAVTIAALATLVTLAMPPLQGHLQRQRLKALAQELAMDMAEARFEAARSARTLHLRVTPGESWCYAVATTAQCDCRQPQACQVKALRAEQRPGLQLLEGHALSFDPTAPAGSATVAAVLANARGERLRVDVAANGRTRVCAPEAPLSTIPAC